MKNITILFIAFLALLTSCEKKVQEDEFIYLVFRDGSGEILVSEEARVTEHTNKVFLIKTGSNNQLNYLEKDNGKWVGEIEIYRQNSGYYYFDVELEGKVAGRTIMEGSFSGQVDELFNDNYTGESYELSGELEVRD